MADLETLSLLQLELLPVTTAYTVSQRAWRQYNQVCAGLQNKVQTECEQLLLSDSRASYLRARRGFEQQLKTIKPRLRLMLRRKRLGQLIIQQFCYVDLDNQATAKPKASLVHWLLQIVTL